MPRTETPGTYAAGQTAKSGWIASHWLRSYRKQDAVPDLVAGAVTATMLVPQAMAYAILAGLPVELGLYASILPLLAYALFGSSRALAIGPVAMVSLLIAVGIGPLAAGDPQKAVQLAIQLALMVGLIMLLMGVFRAGFLVNFLSHPVLSGFTSAAALVIGVSQLKHILGIDVPRSEHPWELFRDIGRGASDLRTLPLLFGGGAVLLLFAYPTLVRGVLSRLGARPETVGPVSKIGPLIAVVLGIVLARQLNGSSLPVVGTIPDGLPVLALPELDLGSFRKLLPTALVISFVAFVESFAVAQVLASKRRQRVHANQDLFALGIANLTAAFSGGYSVAGGFGRSAVNFQSGARTGLAAIFTAGVVACTLLFLTPVLYHLPKAILGAIILVAITSLVDVKGLVRIWRYSKRDAWCWLTTFGGVIWLGIEDGLVMGAILAIVFFLYRTSFPHVAVVGRVEGTEQYRDVLRHRVRTSPGILAIRLDESLFFGNVRGFEDLLLNTIAADPSVRHVLLIGSGANFIDETGLTSLQLCRNSLKDVGVSFSLATFTEPVLERLERIGFLDEVGRENLYPDTHAAVVALEERMEHEAVEAKV